MKRNMSSLMIIAIVVIIFTSINISEASSKPYLTVYGTKWFNTREEIQWSYYNEHKGYAGTMNYLTDSRIYKMVPAEIHSALCSNSPAVLNNGPPHYESVQRYVDYLDYDNPEIISYDWTGPVRSGYFIGLFDGKQYKYARDYRCNINHEILMYEVRYKGILYKQNKAPIIESVSVMNEKDIYHNQDRVRVKICVKDEDIGDTLRIKYTINNLVYTLDNSLKANGTSQMIYEDIPIPNGYTGSLGIKFNCYDNENKRSDDEYINVRVTNVLEDVYSDLTKHIMKDETANLRFVIVDTDDVITEVSSNNAILNDIERYTGDKDLIGMYIACDESQSLFKSNTTGFVSGLSGRVDKIVNHIVEKNRNYIKSDTEVFMVGDYIDNNILFDDVEKDYSGISMEDKIKENECLDRGIKKPKDNSLYVLYQHNPDIFDMPEQRDSRDDGAFHKLDIGSKEDFIIDRAIKGYRGQWVMHIRAMDDTRIDGYDKSTQVKEKRFVIHAKPKACMTRYETDTANQYLLSGEQSFDIDYINSKPNNGILKYLWKYQLEDDSEYIHTEGTDKARVSINKYIKNQMVKNVSLTVEDYNGGRDTVSMTLEVPTLQEPKASLLLPRILYIGEKGSDMLWVDSDTYPRTVVNRSIIEFDFDSVNSYLDSSKDKSVEGYSYHFKKNSLRYNSSIVKNKNIKHIIAYIMPNKNSHSRVERIDICEKEIEFKHIEIEKFICDSMNQGILTSRFLIKNSNDLDHRVSLSLGGRLYDLIYDSEEGLWHGVVDIGKNREFKVSIYSKNDSEVMYDDEVYEINNPPVITIESLIPGYIYEGDDIVARILCSDPDIDTLNMRVTTLDKAGEVVSYEEEVKPVSGAYGPLLRPVLNSSKVGKYTVVAHIEDPMGYVDSDNIAFTVHGLSLDGMVSHTKDWESNRKKYNETHGKDLYREDSVFWAGEKIMLSAKTTDIEGGSNIIANQVNARIEGTTYNTTLEKLGDNNWSGELWAEDMLEKWQGERIPLQIVFTTVYSNGTIEEDRIEIIIDDRDKFWKLHRKF